MHAHFRACSAGQGGTGTGLRAPSPAYRAAVTGAAARRGGRACARIDAGGGPRLLIAYWQYAPSPRPRGAVCRSPRGQHFLANQQHLHPHTTRSPPTPSDQTAAPDLKHHQHPCKDASCGAAAYPVDPVMFTEDVRWRHGSLCRWPKST